MFLVHFLWTFITEEELQFRSRTRQEAPSNVTRGAVYYIPKQTKQPEQNDKEISPPCLIRHQLTGWANCLNFKCSPTRQILKRIRQAKILRVALKSVGDGRRRNARGGITTPADTLFWFNAKQIETIFNAINLNQYRETQNNFLDARWNFVWCCRKKNCCSNLWNFALEKEKLFGSIYYI